MPGRWVGPILGGSILSALSAGGTYVVEKRAPTPKSMARDFILGAVLIMMITQLLPESTNTLVLSILAFWSSYVGGSGSQSGGGSTSSSEATKVELLGHTETVSASASAESGGASVPVTMEEMEVKVGVPRF